MKQNVGFSVSPAALTTGLTHLTVKLSTFVEKPTALLTGTQKVGGNIRILGRIRALYSQSDFRGKY